MIASVIAAFIYLSVTVNVRTAIAEIKQICESEKV